MASEEEKDFFMIGVYANSMRNILECIKSKRFEMSDSELRDMHIIMERIYNDLGEYDPEERKKRIA